MAGWDRTLTELVQLRGAALKRYGYLLCGDDSTAEDLVQDALVRTFTSRRQSDLTHAEQYVRKVMLNIFLDQTRRRRVWLRLVPQVLPWPPPDEYAHRELRGDLRSALLALSPRQRACVVLHYYLDLPVAEIGDHLGMSLGTVKRHLFEARSRLADHLEPDEMVADRLDPGRPGPARRGPAGTITAARHTTEDGYATS